MRSASTIPGLKVSFVLDRRSFLTGAAGVVAAVPAVWSLALEAAPTGNPEASNPVAGAVAGDSMEWGVDHIFGTYPPYAHPIPYGRQADPSPAPFDPDAFDPILMI